MNPTDSLHIQPAEGVEGLLEATFRQVDAYRDLFERIDGMESTPFSEIWHAIGLAHGQIQQESTGELVQRALSSVRPPAPGDARRAILIRSILREFGHFAVAFHEALQTVSGGSKIEFLHAYKDATDYVHGRFARTTSESTETVHAQSL